MHSNDRLNFLIKQLTTTGVNNYHSINKQKLNDWEILTTKKKMFRKRLNRLSRLYLLEHYTIYQPTYYAYKC